MKIPQVKYNIEKACWEGYEMYGMKEKKGKMVPNCVPTKKSEPDIGTMLAKTEELLAQVQGLKKKEESSEEYAGHMVKSNLYKMAKYAQELHNMFEDDENVEPWVEEKIAVAASMISQVKHYIEYERVREGREDDGAGVVGPDEKEPEMTSDEEMTKAEKPLPPLARHGIEVEQALTFENEPQKWFVKKNGFQHGGDIDNSGAGNLTFPSELEAYRYAKTLIPKGSINKAEGDKKYSKKVTNPETGREKTVRYGAKGYTIAPGTSRGDSYCARSYGQMKDHPSAANDPNSPLRLSRKKWKCSGKTSRKSELDVGEMMGKTEELLAQVKKLKGE